ncbi:helix-turn-helix domain-containing protein [Actinoallomurus sp. NPDC050550]|uniref:helix-turn-helix transcriptional regulator n=1 Tax=Actinoallomurus sp. NPDC050550 TaxID=3154937 RepID=UPI00340A8C88
MLDALGLDSADEAVYRSLIEVPGASADALAASTGLSPQQVRASLRVLEDAGLVSRMSGQLEKYIAAPPDVALETLVLEREAELSRVRAAARQLAETYQRALGTRHPAELVEIVAGREAVMQRTEQLQRGARHEVRVFDRPPYVNQPHLPNHVELEMLRRGVVYRAVYDRASLEVDGWWKGHHEPIAAAGEQARVMSGVPMKMMVADDRLAIVPLRIDASAIESCAIVHSSELLDALCALFETLWRLALPLRVPGDDTADVPGAGPTPFEAQLVAMLTAGLGDEAISRQVGLSYRTLQRRVRDLMTRLGARTRFQAGLQAAFQGWVTPPAARPADDTRPPVPGDDARPERPGTG